MKDLILIPAWVSESLDANNYSIEDVVKEEVLLSTLSNDDVGFYIFITTSNLMDRLLDLDLMPTLSLLSYDRKTEMASYVDAHVMENKAKPYSLGDMLFNATDAQNVYNIDDCNFEIKEINENTIGLVPTKEKDKGFSHSMIKKELVKTISKYTNFKDLVKTTLFKSYIVGV